MATFQAVIFKGDVHIKQDNTTNIKIRITHNRKCEYISTDLYVRPNKFESGQAKGDNSLFINGRIRDELTKYQANYLKIGSIAEKLTVKELKERITTEDYSEDINFLKFADEYAQTLKDQGREGSARGLNGVISNLKKFRPKLLFSEINLLFLNDFVVYLKSQGVKNAVDNYMREFRVIFNAGREKYNDEDRGLIRIQNYPFKKFKFEKIKRKTNEYSLSVNELKLFINYKPDRERLQMAKDMFLLMFYLIGINTADLYKLGKPDKKGRVNYIRAKTKREYSIKLEPEAKEIINRYKGKDFLINMSDRYGQYLDWNHYVNIELKKIGEKITAELQKKNPKASFPGNMSTNWARHTWASIARNDCRINKDDVALCLGHEDIDNKVTDIYINYDYRIIDESNRKVLDMIKG